jgi:hypothetical protein
MYSNVPLLFVMKFDEAVIRPPDTVHFRHECLDHAACRHITKKCGNATVVR